MCHWGSFINYEIVLKKEGYTTLNFHLVVGCRCQEPPGLHPDQDPSTQDAARLPWPDCSPFFIWQGQEWTGGELIRARFSFYADFQRRLSSASTSN